jgi:hypothetical protein
MKAFKTLVLAKSAAAALIATAGIAAPAISHASPDDGMVCRSSYNGAVDGGRFKCSKLQQIDVGLECTNIRFPNIQRRVVALPQSDGKDVCTRPGITVAANGPLTGLTLGQDYVFAAANEASITARINRVRDAEASQAGVPVTEVDVVRFSRALAIDGGFGGNDVTRIGLKVFTFAIPATSLLQPIFPTPGVVLPSPILP